MELLKLYSQAHRRSLPQSRTMYESEYALEVVIHPLVIFLSSAYTLLG